MLPSRLALPPRPAHRTWLTAAVARACGPSPLERHRDARLTTHGLHPAPLRSSLVTHRTSRSILPPAYVAYFAFRADFADTRLTTMLLLTLVWGGRLSYNFFRKGGLSVRKCEGRSMNKGSGSMRCNRKAALALDAGRPQCCPMPLLPPMAAVDHPPPLSPLSPHPQFSLSSQVATRSATKTTAGQSSASASRPGCFRWAVDTPSHGPLPSRSPPR